MNDIVRRSYANALWRADRIDEAKAIFEILAARSTVPYSQMATELSLATFWLSQGEVARSERHVANYTELFNRTEAERSSNDLGDNWRSWLIVQNMQKQLSRIRQDP